MLKEIAGVPLILHVFNRVKEMGLFDQVYVATDHIDIKNVIESVGGTAIMTDPELPSGTDRIISSLAQIRIDYDYVVNVQGDEALISANQLGPLVALLNGDKQIDLATLCVRNSNQDDFKNSNCVKLVKSAEHRVLYFSRSGIPFNRDQSFDFFFQHIGVYAFSKHAIQQISELEESELEKRERLEQLRWMEAGLDIYASEVTGQLIGIDTKEDLDRVAAMLS